VPTALLNDSGPEVAADNTLKRRGSESPHAWAHTVTNMLQRMDRPTVEWHA